LDLTKYLAEQSLILVPVIWIIGAFLKRTPMIANWLIPWILLVVGIAGAVLKLGMNIESILQGIIITGAAVLGHQLIKQTTRRD